MVKNVTWHNPIHQEENTPLVTITSLDTSKDQATANDARGASYVIDLAKAAFGGTHYPVKGSQWYLKKISGVWTLMARAPRQNPQLGTSFTPSPGDSFIGDEGKTSILGSVAIPGSFSGSLDFRGAASGSTNLLSMRATGDTNDRFDINASGAMSWGPGNAATDTVLQRQSSPFLALLTTNEFWVSRPATTNTALLAQVNTATTSNFVIRADGQMQWGSGSASRDTTLSRTGVGALTNSGSFTATQYAWSDAATAFVIEFNGKVTGDTNDRLRIFSSGRHEWGPGNTATDTTLYRNGVGLLQTDGIFNAGTISGLVIKRGRRTTNSTASATEQGVLRIDNISLLANRLYFICAPHCYVNAATGTTTIPRAVLRISTSGTATITSTLLSTQQGSESVAALPPTVYAGVFYAPGGSNQTASVLLSSNNANGTGVMVQMLGSATDPIDLYVIDCGPDPGDSGVSI